MYSLSINSKYDKPGIGCETYQKRYFNFFLGMQNRNNHNVFSLTAVRFGVYEFKCFKLSWVEQFFCVIFKHKIQTFVHEIIFKKNFFFKYLKLKKKVLIYLYFEILTSMATIHIINNTWTVCNYLTRLDKPFEVTGLRVIIDRNRSNRSRSPRVAYDLFLFFNVFFGNFSITDW